MNPLIAIALVEALTAVAQQLLIRVDFGTSGTSPEDAAKLMAVRDRLEQVHDAVMAYRATTV